MRRCIPISLFEMKVNSNMKSSLSLLGEQEVRWQAESTRLGRLVEAGKLQKIIVQTAEGIRAYDFQATMKRAQAVTRSNECALPSDFYGPIRTMMKNASADLFNVTGSQDEVWRLRDIAERGDVYTCGSVQINSN